MPVGINQPSNQIKLTNVSLVRMRKGKKRFEIACYKNKVQEWRTGIEKDLDNVLQIPQVFLNVSKGQVAPHDDVKKSFGADKKVDDVILEILNKGELQVGAGERHEQLESLQREVVDIVSGRLVDPKSKRVYTSGMIEKALDQLSQASAHAQQEKSDDKKHNGSGAATPSGAGGEAGTKRDLPTWTGVTTNKSAKAQALAAIKALIAWQPIPVARARMRLRITCPTSVLKQAVKTAPTGTAAPAAESKSHSKSKKGKKSKGDTDDEEDGEEKVSGTVKDILLGYVEQVESQDVTGDEWEVVGFVEPGDFRLLSEFVATHTKGRARAEVLDTAVVHED